MYRVRTKAGNYIVHLEEYTNDVFIAKFFPARLKRYDNRFQAITNKFVMQVVVGSVLHIMHHHFVMVQNASFGFIASRSIIGTSIENRANNQRFRIYKRIMVDFFGVETFQHLEDEKNSAYLMINRRKDFSGFVNDLTVKFSDLYPDLINLEFTNIKHE